MDWWYIPSPCYLVIPGASLVPRTPPTIEELLWTIRDAWPPPRSLSLDSEQRDKPAKVAADVMGTGKKDQPAPRMGLPYRRYSVPETVMRKYTLSRAQTSASDVVTAPTPSVPSIGTSSGAVRRMCHKACQTSAPDSHRAVPTVNIIPSQEVSKHSSNSELAPSEEVFDYVSANQNQVYNELNLPGAVIESARFLRVPDLILDPHDSPQVSEDDVENYDSELRNSVVLDQDKCTETDNTLDENLSSLMQSDIQHDKLSTSRSRIESSYISNGLHAESNQRISPPGERHHDQIFTEELTIEQQLHFEQSLSPEGTPTPAPTCHTYDSQGNMLSECYITDCEACNAEGRKCCSLDDSGSQSCSFTSPEMMSSNELKSSTDFTTSSMTLDQTVSDRTTSTQDSTVSLTSITPESAESKGKCSNINISPILVIDSETTLVDVSPKSKQKDSTHQSESNLDVKPKPLDLISAVISCESGIVPEPQNLSNNKIINKNTEEKEERKISITSQTYLELNNNKITMTKDIYTQLSEPLSTIKENEIFQTLRGGAKYQADHYLYISESESGLTQGSVSSTSTNMEGNQKLAGNQATSHLYLTETESTPTEDTDHRVNKNITGAYKTDFLYMTESESSVAPKTTSSDTTDAGHDQPKAGNYTSNYMYMSESESSGLTKTVNNGKNSKRSKKNGGNYSKNYLYMTETESPDTCRTSASESKDVEIKETSVHQDITGAYNTNYLYITESDSSEVTGLVHSNVKEGSELIRKNAGTYTKNYMYMTESDSLDTRGTARTDTEEHTDIKEGNDKEELETEEENEKSPKALETATKSAGNCATDYLYMTETESSDTKEREVDKEEKFEKRKNAGNYSSNYMYMTESESPSDTCRSEENRNIKTVKSSNYATECLYMTESEKSKETTTSTPVKEDTAVSKQGGNFTTDYLYMSESDLSGNKVTDVQSEVEAIDQKAFGNSTTNYLYMTESSSTSKSQEDERYHKNKKTGGRNATSNFYITESESTPTTKRLSQSEGDGECKGLSYLGENKSGKCTTDYLYMTESNSSDITKVSTPENKKDISKNVAGNYTKGYLYMTESESSKTQSSSEKIQNANISHKPSKNYKTNYMYMTEDESGFNPDSLEINTPCSRDDFEMDSLAINESTDESNMLENLGFTETCSILDRNSDVTIANTTVELRSENTQDKFCGNIKYEVISKCSDAAKGNFKGNVMPALEDKLGPQPCNLLTSRKTSSPPMKTNQNYDLECNISVDNENGKLVDQETTMGSVAGGTYWEIPGKELVIPRFSALPRTLSMIVNTSSMDCSSDSDLSLADSLEDSKSDDKNRGLKLYNKYDNRLVRGDVITLLPEESEAPKKTSKESQAYFLSITGEEGEIKVEQIPEELKKKLLKRGLEVKKHSDQLSTHAHKCKGKNCLKKSKKQHHHCCSSAGDLSSKCSSKTRSLDEFSGKMSKFTQWEDLDSSKDSSDTLVPSDSSEKDKDVIFQGDYKLKDVSTSPRKCEFIDNDQQNDLNCWLETVNSSATVDDENDKENNKNTATTKRKTDKKPSPRFKTKAKEVQRLQNKWVQCENMPHVDSDVDKEISHLLIENSNDENEIDSTGGKKLKCADHQVPFSKDMFVQVSEDILVQDIVDSDVISNAVTESKSVQTPLNNSSELSKSKKENPNRNKPLLEDPSNKLELNLTGSPRINHENCESEIQILNVTSEKDEERCKTPVLGERPDSKTDNITKLEKQLNKPTPKFNVKSTPSRRPGNLGTRFKQKFEVIPEEKSGSFESSNDEKKSPKPTRGRRASMPSEIILKDIAHSQNKSSDSSTSSSDKKDDECVRNFQSGEGDYPRRHTIHGNLTRNTKTEVNNQDKNEHSRRHTIHGSLSLSKSDAMLKQLNLLGGTLLKGRVFGKQSGVMFGRFRPINEETQVQKDERSLVEEQLERLRGDASKGREALAVAQTEGESEDLLTLSKGWINFYLLGDSQDLNSDGSNADEGSKDGRGEDRKRSTPLMKTVTVVGKSEEDLRHQFTVQINASPETCPEAGKLPNICDQNKSFKTPSLSPDLTLPDITPTSSPATTPPLPDTPHLKPELPQINPKSRNKRNDKFKNGKKPEKTEKREKVQIDNDQNLRYMKLSSMKHELQTEKTYFARSGEVACSELSQSSSTSVTADSPTLPSIKWPSRQLQRRSHSRHLHTRAASNNAPANPQACWTVTLAGSSGNPTQPPPDVEMRLSFSNQQRGPATSQSDSGLGEDGPPERGHRGHHALPPPSKHPPPDTSQWKVLLKTHQETEKSTDQIKAEKRASLPDFNFTPSTARQKKNSKRGGRCQEDPSRPGSVQVQEILEHNISLHKSRLLL
ncbi:uro-adherence factor A-like isoform X2 [Macrosteles quadrilineatus]|uniref:uro-adherence factor A-like isoform X2 n=1 Tax=Macrosteles quadrilineatus TaxID=74068 RepID=UPI0023E2E0A1|nr:uro-adherence factor A-like isoform X2 [Macrosteles quadrilineatus]